MVEKDISIINIIYDIDDVNEEDNIYIFGVEFVEKNKKNVK